MPFCGGAFVVSCWLVVVGWWLLVGGCWLVVYMPGTLVAIRLGERGSWFLGFGFWCERKTSSLIGKVSLVC